MPAVQKTTLGGKFANEKRCFLCLFVFCMDYIYKALHALSAATASCKRCGQLTRKKKRSQADRAAKK